MRFRLLIGLTVCAVALPVAAAHHSHGNYDQSTWSTLEGRVQEVHLINPHSWIYLEIEDPSGETAVWALEAAGPDAILGNGVMREDVQKGDVVQVRCHRLRDGSPGCLLGFVTPLHGDSARGHGIEKDWD